MEAVNQTRWLLKSQRVDKDLTFDRASHHAAHKVALQSEEDKQWQDHADESRRSHQMPILTFFTDQAGYCDSDSQRNWKIAKDARAGTERGRIILVKMVKLEAPSI